MSYVQILGSYLLVGAVMGAGGTLAGYWAGVGRAGRCPEALIRCSTVLALCNETVREDVEIMKQASEGLAKMRPVIEACAHRPMMGAEDLAMPEELCECPGVSGAE